ncbi:MAG: DUF4350 domain-containing protein [Candidatus Natronoplasma sp.]
MNMKKITIYIVVMSIFALILFLSVSAPLLMNDADFSIYNPGWNGCSDMAVRTEELGKFTPNIELSEGKSTDVTQRELTEYDVEADETSMLIIGPRQEFTESEKRYIDEFLEEGGRLLLADNFGSGNSLLEGLDTNSSFHSAPLLDLAFDKDPHFGVAYDVREHEMTRNISHVMLNNPTAIDKGEEAVSLLNSSRGSWLDEGESTSEEDRDHKQYPLITVEDYGKGELILISDPSIFINSMRDKMDNDILRRNLLNFLSEGRENIIFDESKREMDFVYRVIYRGEYPERTTSAVIVLAVTGVSLFVLFPESKSVVVDRGMKLLHPILRKEEEEKDPLTKVLNNHPDWDKNKLQMIDERFIKSDDGDGEIE